MVNGDVKLAGADLAEQFEVVGDAVDAGSVVVLAGDDRVTVSSEAYDHRVAGVVSGAGSYRPGIVLDRKPDEGRCPLALSGKVWCKVDASDAPIEVGDMLTTSATPGHATAGHGPGLRVRRDHRQGARAPRSGPRPRPRPRGAALMILRTELGRGVESLEELRALTGVERPASVKEMLARYREPIVFDEPLVTPPGVPLGGHQTVTFHRNGDFRHEGHMRATGAFSFQYGVRTMFSNDAGLPLMTGESGHVGGSNSFDDRVSSWDKTDHNGLLALHWAAMKRARAETTIDRDSELFGAFGDVAEFLGSLVVGAAFAGPAGVCIVLGAHAADAAGLDEEFAVGGLPGLLVTGGTLLVFGPSAIVPALVAGAAVGTAFELSLKHRDMTVPEREFAKEVFGPNLPVDQIRLTNLLGIGHRPFTIPTVGGTILVNLGEGLGDPIGYDGLGDPDNPQRQAPGQLFIHELAHAWQIDTASFLPGLMCDAVAASATTVGGNMGVYEYGAPDQAFSDFNPEQQASIVDDWFAGSGERQKDFNAKEQSDVNPYWRYIRDNIRRRLP